MCDFKPFFTGCKTQRLRCRLRRHAGEKNGPSIGGEELERQEGDGDERTSASKEAGIAEKDDQEAVTCSETDRQFGSDRLGQIRQFQADDAARDEEGGRRQGSSITTRCATAFKSRPVRYLLSRFKYDRCQSMNLDFYTCRFFIFIF